MRRFLTHPWLALPLGIALLIDIGFWGTQSSHRHVALLAAPCRLFRLGRSVTPAIPRAFVIEEEGRLTLVDVYSGEGYAIRPQTVRGLATAFPMEHSYGLLAKVVSSRNHALSASSAEPARPFNAAEIATIRTQFTEFLRTYRGGYLANTRYLDAFAKGDGTLTTFHLPAALHDLLALGALATTIAGARRFLRERKDRRRRLAIEESHRCPKCGYDITGIPDRCPECGRRLET